MFYLAPALAIRQSVGVLHGRHMQFLVIAGTYQPSCRITPLPPSRKITRAIINFENIEQKEQINWRGLCSLVVQFLLPNIGDLGVN